MKERAKRWAYAAFVVLAGVWAFSSSLRGGWLWDDDQYVTQNPLLRSATGLESIWFAPPGVNYFPVTDSVRWIQWHLWESAPLGYRLTNLALHLCAALLIWRLADRLHRCAAGPAAQRWEWGPALASLLFAVHPLAVESVAWISELKNVLSLPLLLLALDAWLDFGERGGGRHWLRALAWFIAAMLAKSTVAMFPVVLLMLVGWRTGRVGAATMRAVAPFFIVSLGLGIATLWFEHVRAIGIAGPPLEGLGWRLIGAGRVALFYLGRSVWPGSLMPIYPRWGVDPPAFSSFLAWAVLAAAGAWLTGRPKRWRRHVLFGLGSFFANLLPVLGVVPMAYLRLAWVADHFAYLPLVSIVILAGEGFAALADRLARPRPALGKAAIASGVAALLGLACASQEYARAFASPEALWTCAVRRNPRAWSAHNDLGSIRYDQSRLPEAVAEFQEATRLNPGYSEAWNNLGAARAEQREFSSAEAACRRALELRPAYAAAWCNLGNVLLQTDRLGAAVDAYRQALRLRDSFPEARYNLALALRALGRTAEADREFERSGLPPP